MSVTGCRLMSTHANFAVPDGFPTWLDTTDPGDPSFFWREGTIHPGPPQVCLSTPQPWGAREGLTLSPWLLFTLPVRPVSTSREIAAKRWRGAARGSSSPIFTPLKSRLGKLTPPQAREDRKPCLGVRPHTWETSVACPVVLGVGGTQAFGS